MKIMLFSWISSILLIKDAFLFLISFYFWFLARVTYNCELILTAIQTQIKWGKLPDLWQHISNRKRVIWKFQVEFKFFFSNAIWYMLKQTQFFAQWYKTNIQASIMKPTFSFLCFFSKMLKYFWFCKLSITFCFDFIRI